MSYGCATVSIIGHGFIPSTFKANSVALLPSNFVEQQSYTYISVLGGGNIATSFSICHVTKGQTLTIYALDEASKNLSAPVTINLM